MSVGKQIRVYLVDGTPGGLLTAEIGNWTGHIVAAPRSDIGQLLAREECRRTGVYILIGDDPNSSVGTAVYIGEGDDIAKRLRQHARAEEHGGKDFWDRVVLLTSKDANLTKAHARYLESRFINLATSARRSRVTNGTAPTPIQLPEADIADMEFYLAQAHIVLPVLGVNVFRAAGRVAGNLAVGRKDSLTSAALDGTSPEFTCEITKHRLVARAREIDGEFTMLEGSFVKSQWTGTRHPGNQTMHATFLEDGTFRLLDDDRAVLTRDVAFTSPSAAAAVMAGRSANGRTAWVDPKSGMTFGEWQNREIAPQTDAEPGQTD